MAKSTLQHEIAGFLVPQNSENGYLNATALTKAYENYSDKRRDVRDWLGNKRTKETLKHLSLVTGIPVSKLTAIKKGRGDVIKQGTYIHPRLAVRFGIWLSDEFGLMVEEVINDWMINGAGNPLWHENRKQLKGSNRNLRDAIKRYVDRHSEELSDNKKKYVYSNVNDKLAIAIVGCRPAKFRRDNKTNTFREALNKDQLKDLELLESVVIRLIDKDIYPLDAIQDARERLMLVAS